MRNHPAFDVFLGTHEEFRATFDEISERKAKIKVYKFESPTMHDDILGFDIPMGNAVCMKPRDSFPNIVQAVQHALDGKWESQQVK